MQICSAGVRVSHGLSSTTVEMAHLTSVGILAPDDPTSDDIDVGIIKDDGRRLSAELESDGSAVQRRGGSAAVGNSVA